MKKLALIIALALPSGALAQDYSEEQKAAFIAAFAANGCTMTEDEAKTLMPAAGFERETSSAIAQALLADGLASGDEATGVLTLSAEICK